jgi:hypothetical protein
VEWLLTIPWNGRSASVECAIAPKFPPALLAAAEKLAGLTETVAKARAGAESLANQARHLEGRAASLRDEIERSDGSAVAAIAMGIEKADPNRKSKVAAQIAELAAVERDLAETARAQAAAPALFEQVRAPLTDAIVAFQGEYADAERAFAEWASDALCVLNQATSEVKHFANGIKRHGAAAAQTETRDHAPGHPMALFPQLREFNATFNAAESADRPLIRAPNSDELAAARVAAERQRPREITAIGGRN